MKIEQLNLYKTEENSETIKETCKGKTVTIKDRHYSFDGTDYGEILIEELYEVRHTNHLKIKLTDKNVFRIRKKDINHEELLVKLTPYQTLKYRLMFLSGKSILAKACGFVVAVSKAVISIVV